VAIISNAIAIRGGRYSIILVVMNALPGTTKASVFTASPPVITSKSGHKPFDNKQNCDGGNCVLELCLWTAKQF
jgi:hypothetical protein